MGYVALLAADDGAILWHRDFGTAVQTLVGIVHADDGFCYAVGLLLGTTTVDNVTVSSATDFYSDAVLIVLDGTGVGMWGATISGDEATASSSVVEVINGNVDINCKPSCKTVSFTTSDATVYMGEQKNIHGDIGGGSVANISTAGEPMWGADLPLGMAVANDAVYLSFVATGQQTYGDTTFASWESWESYTVRIHAMTGAGEWVLQAGGYSREYARQFATDAIGNLYSVGFKESEHAYFDPVSIFNDRHGAADTYTLFLAKLKTSEEKVPSCEQSASMIEAGHCFVDNVCYENEAPPRTIGTESCMACLAN